MVADSGVAEWWSMVFPWPWTLKKQIAASVGGRGELNRIRPAVTQARDKNSNVQARQFHLDHDGSLPLITRFLEAPNKQ